MLVSSTTPGTAVQLGHIVACEFRIQALSDNTSAVYLDVRPSLEVDIEGDPELTEPLVLNGPVASTKEGVELQPGSKEKFPGPLSQWWMDVVTSGDSVSVTPIGLKGQRNGTGERRQFSHSAQGQCHC